MQLILGSIEEHYDDIDSAMNDCFGIYPDAFFSEWHENGTETWLDIFASYADRTIVGRIME